VPCYRCGNRQVDPEPGQPSPYHRGLVGEHQVLICPACQPAAVADLTRCTGCGGVRLIRRLDQIECLGCGLIREAGTAEAGTAEAGTAEAGTAEAGTAEAGTAEAGAPSGDAPGAPETSGESGMSGAKSAPDIPDISYMSGGQDSALAAEVARALERMRRSSGN
jgi:hypothetical protein